MKNNQSNENKETKEITTSNLSRVFSFLADATSPSIKYIGLIGGVYGILNSHYNLVLASGMLYTLGSVAEKCGDIIHREQTDGLEERLKQDLIRPSKAH